MSVFLIGLFEDKRMNSLFEKSNLSFEKSNLVGGKLGDLARNGHIAEIGTVIVKPFTINNELYVAIEELHNKYGEKESSNETILRH